MPTCPPEIKDILRITRYLNPSPHCRSIIGAFIPIRVACRDLDPAEMERVLNGETYTVHRAGANIETTYAAREEDAWLYRRRQTRTSDSHSGPDWRPILRHGWDHGEFAPAIRAATNALQYALDHAQNVQAELIVLRDLAQDQRKDELYELCCHALGQVVAN